MFWGEEWHDGRGADRDVLRAAEQAVHEATHERGIQTILKNRNVLLEMKTDNI